MAGYFGTEAQQRLQAQAEAYAELMRTTPGACQNGRMMGCDDPDRLGWDMIDAVLARDGVCGFRMIAANRVEALRSQLAARGFRLDTWGVLVGDSADALPVSKAIVEQGPPRGCVDLPSPVEAEGGYTKRIQSLIAEAGVVPFSGSLLIGDAGPAMTVVVGDEADAAIAAAHCYLPHNAHSAFHRYAWGGLVAVAETHRGRGLGNYTNARMVVSAFEDLGATHVYELVSATNIPSRRMVESCGLQLNKEVVCGIAAPLDGDRFTR